MRRLSWLILVWMWAQPLHAKIAAHILFQDSPLAGFQYHAGKKLWPQQQERLPGERGAAAGQPRGQLQDFHHRLDEQQLAWGRPADVLVMPDGSLLVSDDHAGAIYRITYRSQR